LGLDADSWCSLHPIIFVGWNDTLLRVIIGLSLFYKYWTIEVIKIDVAFLEGDTENPMYIEWPAGIVHLRYITEEEKTLYCINNSN
jgi:hypothetical protein